LPVYRFRDIEKGLTPPLSGGTHSYNGLRLDNVHAALDPFLLLFSQQ
jgi:hypothetical protein